MINRRRFARSLVAAPVALAMAPLAARAGGDYRFISGDGLVALSSVGLQSWYVGTTFAVELRITPTALEIEALLEHDPSRPDVETWSHADFEFTIFDLDVGSGEIRSSVDQSGFVRKIDHAVSLESTPTIRAIGFNLYRWQPGREIVITAEIDGLSLRRYPSVMVDMMSTVYFPDNGSCSVFPELEDNGGNDLCGEYGQRFRLFDRYGGTEF